MISRFPRGGCVAMHFAAAAQVLLLVEMQLSAISYQLSALPYGKPQRSAFPEKKLRADS
jgi:hypothetical protein